MTLQMASAGNAERLDESFDVSDWLVDRHVRGGRGDHTAIRVGGRSVSYLDLAELTARAGGALATLGVRPGEPVLLVMLDGVEFIAAFLGALRIGAIPLPVNPLLAGSDLAAVAIDAHTRVAIVSAERAALVAELTGGAPGLATVVVTDPGLPASPVGLAAVRTWSELLASAPLVPADPTLSAAGGYWLCTGGTTGRPKLAMHRPADLRTAWETYGKEVLGLNADDRLYSVGPMFHAYGLGNSLVFPLAAGATAVLDPARPPTPARIARLLAEERPTIFFSVPTNYAALAGSELPADAFVSVRTAVSAGETLPAALFEHLRRRFGLEVLDGIGSTEMGHIFVSNRPGHARAGSTGTPVPGFRVRLLDEAGHEVGPDAPASLWVSGPSAACGYWQQESRSSETFVDGWVRTGDTFQCSPAGDYRYVGRTDELFKVAGEWVSPYEVESVIIEHHDVEGVAVVPGPTADGVLQPVAFVVLRAGAETDQALLIAHCGARLAGFKRPKQWRYLTELPKTAAGKIRRNVLREQLRSESSDAR